MATPWQYRQMRSQPRLPFPGKASPTFPDRSLSSSPNLPFSYSPDLGDMSASETDICKYLTKYPKFLEEYVIKNIRVEVIGRWLAQKRAIGDNSVNGGNIQTHSTATTQQKENAKSSNEVLNKVEIGENLNALYQFAEQLRVVTYSSGFSLLSVGPAGKTIILFRPTENKSNSRLNMNPSFNISKRTTVAAHVATTKEAIVVDDVHMDDRFPKRTGIEDSSAVSVLCLPIILGESDLLGVVEFYRSWNDAKYTAEDLKFVQTCADWAAIGIYKTALCKALTQQTEMSDFLLTVSKSYLDDIGHFDQIIKHIMGFAKKLVLADRCSLFLYDKEKDELYSEVFDMGKSDDNGSPIFEKHTEIRFPTSSGIAGFVAKNRNILNIHDAYGDKRFNRNVDKMTGYTTRNILSVPILSNSEVYGVVQMINKTSGGVFTKSDEDNFKIFSLFCALALRYSNVYSVLEQNQNQHQVIYEQFLNHCVCSKKECKYLVDRIESDQLAPTPMDFDEFYFPILHYDDELPDFFIRMLRGLCQPEFDVPANILSRFIVTVRKNYRELPYHNWKHAVTVTHTMYCILLRNLSVFSKFERLGLLVACLCHDLDHRGFTNEFLQKSKHPLASLYPNSTMENHHYEMTVLLLESCGHQIFSMLDDASYKTMMELIRTAIISTDLAQFFVNQKKIGNLLQNGELDLNDPEQRKTVIGIAMTASDLSSTAKHWEPTKATVLDLYQEFWNEGDIRKENGFPLVAMMDRLKANELAQGQVGFFANVSIKCYETLSEIFPECNDMLNLAQENLVRWRNKDEEDRRTAEGESDILDNISDLMPHGFELGFMLRGGMWVIEKSRSRTDK